MRLQELDGRKVGIWGAGEEGHAAYEAVTREAPNAEVIVLSNKAADVEAWGDVAVQVGDDASLLSGCDVVIRSPGISKYRPDLAELVTAGTTVTTGTSIWFSETGARSTIAVTGTKGKSTTSSLIAHLLHALGHDARLAGNIGRPLLDLLGESPAEVYVLELSSYQTSDLEMSPGVAVLTSLSPEHLNWHGDAEAYYRDKLNLFRWSDQTVSVLNMADPKIVEFASQLPNVVGFGVTGGVHVRDGAFYDGQDRLFGVEASRLPGRHNEINVCGALTAMRVWGSDLRQSAGEIERALQNFAPLAHRLEPIAEIHNVTYIDDGLATTPEATIAALDAYDDRAVTLIVGGFDRDVPYDRLANVIAGRSKPTTVLTIPDNGTRVGAIVDIVVTKRGADARVVDCDSLADAVGYARRNATPGSAVLLSPAAPSFGVFENYKERSALFRRLMTDS